MNDIDRIFKILARMRGLILKEDPNLTTTRDVLECALDLEIYQKAILKERADLEDRLYFQMALECADKDD